MIEVGKTYLLKKDPETKFLVRSIHADGLRGDMMPPGSYRMMVDVRPDELLLSPIEQ